MVSLINKIYSYGRVFKEHILDFRENFKDESNPICIKHKEHVKRLLLILEVFDVKMFYPYILKRLFDVNGDIRDTRLINDFKILESFIIRRRLSPKGVNDYAIKYNNILKDGVKHLIEMDLTNDNSILSDNDIEIYINNITDDKTAKVLLFCIEMLWRDNGNYDITALEYKYTLEHIMPKSWQQFWFDVTITDKQGTVLDPMSEEGKHYRNLYIRSIGNMTLLTYSLNSGLKNADFKTKVEGRGEAKPGYRSHTSLRLTKEIVDGYYSDTVWDEDRIDKRAKRLLNVIRRYLRTEKPWKHSKSRQNMINYLCRKERKTAKKRTDGCGKTDVF